MWIEVTRLTRNGPQILRAKTSISSENIVSVDEMAPDSPPSLEIGAQAAIAIGGTWFHVAESYADIMVQVKSSNFAS